MKYVYKVFTFMLLLALMMPAFDLSNTAVYAQDAEEDVQLVTAKVAAEIVQEGRVLMHARGNRWVYDSVPPLGGPNEEVNPLDGMLSALISCGMYIYEAVGIEEGIETNNLSATVQGEIDPRGVAGAPVNPRVRAFHVTINVDGPTADEAAMMAESFSTRCPIYTTLSLSADITVINVVDGEEQEPFSTEADPIVNNDIEGEEPELAMPAAAGSMMEFGRSLMSARGNRWVNDSVPPIKGPNEEVNPLDMFAGALPACGLMIYEAVARDEGIPLHYAKATVEADLDPRGVAGADVDPRIRAFRVNFEVDGPTAEEAEMMAEQFSTRCPIYTTFERSAPIEVTNVLMAGSEMTASAGEMSLNVEFVNHIVAGMPEPDVHLLHPEDDSMVFRMGPDEAEDESLMEQVVYSAAEFLEHDMFEVLDNPRGPYPMGEELGFTMGEWLAATGSGSYTINSGVGHVDLSFGNLIPNGVYTLWCSRIYTPPAFEVVSVPCGEANGSNNAFVADEDGNGAIAMDILPLPGTEEDKVSLLALAYHSDGNTHGSYHGDFSVVTHVQSFAMLPPFADEAWQVGGAMAVAEESAAAAPALATAKAVIDLSNQSGRSIVSARGSHFIIDSAPPLGHPAQETNPLEAMLGALATCGAFVYEAAAKENDIPLTAGEFTVQGDFNVKGLTGEEAVNPKVQQFRVHANLEGPSDEEAAMMAEQFSIRCPIYTTLIKAAPIIVTHNGDAMGGPVAEGLATGTVVATLSNQPGRAILNVRENFQTIDSVPPLGGPNEEVNPMDLMLAAMGTCGTFLFETAARDMEIPLDGAKGMIEVDFDPKGIKDGSVDPALQAMRINWQIGAESDADAEILLNEWLTRCPIYNTLIETTEIDVNYELMSDVMAEASDG